MKTILKEKEKFIMKKMNNKGFSLVELIVVIAIMAVLVGVLAPQFIKYVENSRRATDVSTAENLRESILADIADQKAPFDTSKGKTNISGKGSVDTDYCPTAVAEAPKMKSSDSKYKGKDFQAAWNVVDGTCDVYSADGTFILTDPYGAAAYKNQDKNAPGSQKPTVKNS